jgi:Spy/CpxP family protein refolding chaperone
MQQIRQRTDQRIESVLSAEQRTKYQEFQKQMQQRRGRGRGGDDRPQGERRGK